MHIRLRWLSAIVISFFVLTPASLRADDVKDTEVYARIKAYVDSIPAIDTHSHLQGPGLYKFSAERDYGKKDLRGCGLRRIWRHSYFTWGHGLTPWPNDDKFETWWNNVQRDFNNSRARSAYRCMLPIFTDLYGVDFETLDCKGAKELSDRIEKNMVKPDWAEEAIRKRGNTEIVVTDSYVMPLQIREHYPFVVSTINVRWLINGFHQSEFKRFGAEDPYAFAKHHKLPVKTLDDYVAVLDRILAEGKKAGAVCLKNQSAYDRSIRFDWTPKQRAEEAFGKPRKDLKPWQVKAFQDYVFWKLCELAAKHDLPFQIHTGHARIATSNPMNLVNVISANRKTKFILFHGGFPWVGESGMIALKYPHVALDSCWLPTLSYTMGKRAYKEWLEMFSSNRIMWGSDMFTIEGTYGASMWTRQCIAEMLAEKVAAKELSEKDARRIARQILRENALEMFPSLRKRVKPWPAK
jgi:predicted TIM-barrel fold metal-dependent hydrolase